MNTPTIGALLAQDKIDRYRSFGAFGKPAYQSQVQMRAMLLAQRGPRVANYFARPTYDPDTGELRWTSEVPGTARAWHEMSPDEQARHAPDKFFIHGELLALIDELRKKGGAEQQGGAAAFANLLEQAMKVPADDRYTYFVGDQPMIAFWGFGDAGGASVVASAPVAAARTPDPMTPAPLPVPPPVVLPIEKKRPWWWLLWGLLALLLLAMLFLLLPRACTPDGALVLPPADGAASMPLEPPRADGTLPPGSAQPGAGTAPDGSLPGSPVLPPADGASAAESSSVDPALPAASMPSADPAAKDLPPEPKTEPPSADKDPPKSDPPLDPKSDPAKPPPVDKPMTDPPKPSPVDPKAMKLPDTPPGGADPKKMDFLEGQWRAGEGLVDKRTQQPLDLGFQFNKDGQGEVTVRQPDGTTCKGPVQGRMSGGKLGIEGNQSIPCSNGSAYGAPKIECTKESNGQTQCFGINPDGSRYFMGMKRQ
jgi:hypothetical protein